LNIIVGANDAGKTTIVDYLFALPARMRRAAGGGAPAARATFKAFPIQARSSSITVNPRFSAGMLGWPSAPKALPTNGIRVGVRIGLASASSII